MRRGGREEGEGGGVKEELTPGGYLEEEAGVCSAYRRRVPILYPGHLRLFLGHEPDPQPPPLRAQPPLQNSCEVHLQGERRGLVVHGQPPATRPHDILSDLHHDLVGLPARLRQAQFENFGRRSLVEEGQLLSVRGGGGGGGRVPRRGRVRFRVRESRDGFLQRYAVHLQVCAHRVTSAESLTVAVQGSLDELRKVVAQQRRHREIHGQGFPLEPGVYGLVQVSFAAGLPAAAATTVVVDAEPGGAGHIHPGRGALQPGEKCRRTNKQKQYPGVHGGEMMVMCVCVFWFQGKKNRLVIIPSTVRSPRPLSLSSSLSAPLLLVTYAESANR